MSLIDPGAFIDTWATAVALYRTLWQSSVAGLLNDFFHCIYS